MEALVERNVDALSRLLGRCSRGQRRIDEPHREYDVRIIRLRTLRGGRVVDLIAAAVGQHGQIGGALWPPSALRTGDCPDRRTKVPRCLPPPGRRRFHRLRIQNRSGSRRSRARDTPGRGRRAQNGLDCPRSPRTGTDLREQRRGKNGALERRRGHECSRGTAGIPVMNHDGGPCPHRLRPPAPT